MSLKARITEDMKMAMKAKETARLNAIRLLLAAVKQKEVDERIELDDNAVIAVIEKLVPADNGRFYDFKGTRIPW